MAELSEVAVHPPGRVRRAGGGRKKTVTQDPSLLRDLELLVEPVTRGDPESPLRWTCKSLRKLAEELQRMGHRTSHQLVGRMLHGLGYSLQANSKTLEGSQHPVSVAPSEGAIMAAPEGPWRHGWMAARIRGRGD